MVFLVSGTDTFMSCRRDPNCEYPDVCLLKLPNALTGGRQADSCNPSGVNDASALEHNLSGDSDAMGFAVQGWKTADSAADPHAVGVIG